MHKHNAPPVYLKYAAIVLATETGLGFIKAAIQIRSTNPLAYLALAAMSAVPLLFAWLIFRGRNWARWITVILLLLDIVFTPHAAAQLQARSAFSVWFLYFQTLLEVGVVVLLFLRQSNEWFKKRSSPA